MHFDASADAVAVGLDPLQLERDEAVAGGARVGLVAQQPEARTGAIGHPNIEVAVEVPINHRERAPVVLEIQPCDRGHVGKPAPVRVQIDTFAFVAGPGLALVDQFFDGLPTGQILVQFGAGAGRRR